MSSASEDPSVLTPEEADTLAALFRATPEVRGAYVFGSAAAGQRTSRSDIDLAVWLRDEADPSSTKLDLLADLVRRGFDDVDLVVLDEADLIVQYEALQPNRLLYAADDYSHPYMYSKIMRKYWDFRPYLDVQRAAYKKRLQRGRPGDSTPPIE